MLLQIFDSVNSLSSFGDQGDYSWTFTPIERLSFEAIQVAETYIFAISASSEAHFLCCTYLLFSTNIENAQASF